MLGINGAKERRIALALGALLLVAVGAWLMYETRGTTLWFDEWIWALEYRDNSVGDLIRPHNGHPTLVPVLIYRLLFATVGIDGSAAYRAVGIAGHLLVVAVLFAYALRRAGAGVALVAAVLILLPGTGLAEHHLGAPDRLAGEHRRRPGRPARARPARPRR